MPFELLQGEGADFAYNPMLHGFSKREIQDTIRRMEVLMKDLDHLIRRREREIPLIKMQPNNYIGWDMKKKRLEENYDQRCWAAMDKVGIECELPVVEKALETAPDETPPLGHEDYYQRCENLEERRGEYWKINPTFLDKYGKDREAGIARRTPEKEKYWPTHQVPWEQGANLPSPTPTPLPTRGAPSPRDWDDWDYWDIPQRAGTRAPPGETSPQPKTPSPAPRTPTVPEKALTWSPSSSPEFEFDSPIRTPPVITEYESPSPPPRPAPAEPENLQTNHDCPEWSPEILQDDTFISEAFSPKHLGNDEIEGWSHVGVKEAAEWSPGILQDETIRTEAFSPEQLGVDEMEIMMDDTLQRQRAAELIDPCQIADEAFSPEVLDNDTIQSMLRGHSARISPDIQQRGDGAPGWWNDRFARAQEAQRQETLRRVESAHSRQIDAAAVFGIRQRPISAPPFAASPRPPRSPETLAWGESPVDHITPGPSPTAAPAYSGKGKRLVRPAPNLPPRPHPQLTPPSRLLYPETKGGPTVSQPDRPSTSQTIYNTRRGQYEHLDAWARSPEDLCPYEKTMLFEQYHRPRYERRLQPGPGVVPPRPTTPPPQPPPEFGPYPEDMTVYVPEAGAAPSPTKAPLFAAIRDPFYNTRYKSEERRTHSPVCVPKAGPPPTKKSPIAGPPTPPEYGPEPENLSVYVPESVEESPETLKQRVVDSLTRFESKLQLLQQRLEPRTIYRERSPWVREEYAGQGRREREKAKTIRDEIKLRQKWDNYMLCKYGTVPSPDRRGRMRGIPRTSSTYRPPAHRMEPWPIPEKKKAPVIKPHDEPLHGPWMPWVYGSSRPPPRTAAGRISSPIQPAPKPPVTRPSGTTRCPCPMAARPTTQRPQPPQVQYGSARAPPRTASSYQYQGTPPGRPGDPRQPRRRLLPATPPRAPPAPSTRQMLYGTTRPPPRTAASPRTPC